MRTNAILETVGFTPMINNQEKFWQAVLARDANEDGKFVFAVSSTGVCGGPSCASKRPRRQNVTFYRRPEEAEHAGYRACLRCRPKAVGGSAQNELVKSVCRYIAEHLDESVTLSHLGKAFHQ